MYKTKMRGTKNITVNGTKYSLSISSFDINKINELAHRLRDRGLKTLVRKVKQRRCIEDCEYKLFVIVQ
jgi:hypothetical protein